MDGCSSLANPAAASSCRSSCPAMVTVALFAFITSWNEFLAALDAS